MSIHIHPQARTTQKIRQEIKDSGLPDRRYAGRLGPQATIYVKTHLEVTSGRKGGYPPQVQDGMCDGQRTVVLRQAINPLSLIEQMDRVYVVTSTMDFEALLAGKPVAVFGMPWYAGWGATDDR